MQRTGLKGARLSLQQERVWGFLEESQVYRVQGLITLTGELDERIFQYALQRLAQRHEILQTVFYYPPGLDTPLQVIGQQLSIDCPLVSLEALTSVEYDTLLTEHFTALQNHPCDLAHGPLLKTILFRLSSSVHMLLLALPALCADAASLLVLTRELGQVYESFFQFSNSLEKEVLQYTAVTTWQQKLLASESAQTPREYWSRIDFSQLTRMPLPFERHEVRIESVRDSILVPHLTSLHLAADLCARLSTMAQDYNVSLPSILLACWYVALFRLTDEPEQLVGVAGDGRTHEEFINITGLYTCFVPVCLHIDKHIPFAQFLNTVHLSLQEAMKWQLYFTWPALDAAQSGEKQRSSFPVQFEYENWPSVISSEKLTLSLSRHFSCIEPFHLKLSVMQKGAHLHIDIFADPRSVATDYVPQLSSALDTLLHSIVEQPEKAINAFHILPRLERERLITTFRGVTRPQAFHSLSLPQLFEDQVMRTPTLPAVIGMTEELTYEEVNCRANRLAWVLRHRGVGPDVVVGLSISRSAQMLVAMLAILKAGGAYLPLDSEIPAARLVYQLRNAQALLLLTQQSFLDDLPVWGGETVSIEALQEAALQERETNPPAVWKAEDLAYVIYTSGSTGDPKGVLIQQQSVVNYALAMCDLLGCKPGWQFATVSTIAADLGNTAIFCALLSGGAVQVLDHETVTSGAAFVKWLTQHPVDVLKIVPSHLSALLHHNEQIVNALPRRALVMGGEVLQASLVRRLQEQAKDCIIYNHYGPTETTIGVLVNALKMLSASELEGVALGSPIANMEVYVLDQRLEVVPAGVRGELYIGGPGVALGYLQQPEQTAVSFVPHPFSKQPGRRLYRTGDLVKYTLQNQITFVARNDQQVKLRGYRIELEEVGGVLSRHPRIQNAVVLLRKDRSGAPYLAAYLAVRQQPAPSSDELCDYLSEHLPAYMIPSIFVYLKALPLTANGKVDRQKLLSQPVDDQETDSLAHTSRALVLPRDTIEFQLLQIWEEILQTRPISITDNFFHIGGHSLLFVRLMADILKQFGQELSLSAIFLHPTIAELATVLRQQGHVESQSLLAVIQAQGSRPPLFCVHPSGVIVSMYLQLAYHLGPDQPIYGLQIGVPATQEEDVSSIEDLATRYIAAIQAVQSRGPYLLCGWSMGGVIALEMARQLLEQGHKIALLAIIDSQLADASLRAEAMEEDARLTDEEFVTALLGTLNMRLPEDFMSVKKEERAGYVLDIAKKMNGIPEDYDLEQIRQICSLRKRHVRLAHLYIPQRYPGHIDYFAANNHAQITERGERDDLKLWDEMAAGGISVHAIPGSHREMLEEPHVQILAAVLNSCIDSACNRL